MISIFRDRLSKNLGKRNRYIIEAAIKEKQKLLFSEMLKVNKSNFWSLAANKHRIGGKTCVHMVAWTIDEETIYAFHVEMIPVSFQKAVEKTLGTLKSNGLEIEFIIMDREDILFTDECVVTISHLPAEYRYFFETHNFVPFNDCSVDNSINSDNFICATLDSTKFQLQLLSARKAIYDTKGRLVMSQYLVDPDMLSYDVMDELLDKIKPYCTPASFVVHRNYILYISRAVNALWKFDELQQLDHFLQQAIQRLEDGDMLNTFVGSQQKQLSGKLLLTFKRSLDVIRRRGAETHREHLMIGLEYCFRLNYPLEDPKTVIIKDIRDGREFMTGALRNVYFPTDKKVVWPKINMSTSGFAALGNLFTEKLFLNSFILTLFVFILNLFF